MNELIVLPTSRAVREASLSYSEGDGLIPRMMTLGEFFSRLAFVPDAARVDPTARVLYLREAADFEEFSRIGGRRELLRFFTESDDFFRFFEELALEGVDLETLARCDVYAEYAEHIAILGKLRENYRRVLREHGLSDRMFLPEAARFNESFVAGFERITLHLSGFPSRFEMELLQKTAARTRLLVSLRLGPFNRKVRERFAEAGIELPDGEGECLVDMSRRHVVEFSPRPLRIEARVLSVSERLDQIPAALAAIDEMVRSGIAPERIALVLPDETFAEAFDRYDRWDNLNFSMGFDIRRRREYRVLEALQDFLGGERERAGARLALLGVDPGTLTGFSPDTVSDAEGFLGLLHGRAGLLPEGVLSPELPIESPARELALQARKFRELFRSARLPLREWLGLWLRQIASVRIDDVRGGKVTVLGVLETRGVDFDGVVIVDFNEGIVPASSGKDRFLDSRVREFAGLPSRQDREALQKHYYATLLENAQSATICHTVTETVLPSRFLYELGLGEGKHTPVDRLLLYPDSRPIHPETDPVVESFDPTAQRWSPRKLRTWLECRRKFYYRYVRGLRESSEEFNEGLALHTALEELGWIPEVFADAEGALRALGRILGRVLPDDAHGHYLHALWLRRCRPWIEAEVRRYEAGWRIVKLEEQIDGEFMGFRFTGRIDRIDRRGEETMILDYKTGSTDEANRKRSLENAVDYQLPLYRVLLRPRYGEVEACFVKPFEFRPYEPLAAPEEKEEHLRRILEELAGRESFRAERTETLSRCRYCPYRLLCGRGEYA